MATKYAGQVGLNKLMQIIKTALGNKADKTNATASADGLMSAADKTKLDGIADGANKTTVDAAMSSTSANPVQNKAVQTALDGKYDKSGGKIDGSAEITGSLKVGTSAEFNSSIEAENYIKSDLLVMAPIVSLDDPSKDASVFFGVSGENAAKVTSSVSGGGTQYARFAVGTPTGDNDATTKAYVDSKIAAGGVTVDSAVSADSTNPVQNKVVKSYVDGKVSGLQTAEQVQTAINSALTGVYTPKGSVAFASLPTAAAGNKGWVYNITDAFTTTAAFVEGAGHTYAAGTNVVCVDAGSGSYKWDVLTGTIDLTELTADEVQTLWDSI